ncbi:Dip2/Utp12 family-domain-containing protein [Dipodascopsis uninucleata]
MKQAATVTRKRGNSIRNPIYKSSDSKVSLGSSTKDVEMEDVNSGDDSSGIDDENEEDIPLEERVNALQSVSKESTDNILNGHSTATSTGLSEAGSVSLEGNQKNSSLRLLQVVPSVGSLSTVLTQALRTNDSTLLESCFAFRDEAVIRQTIQRLDATLASALLERLAEKIARTPVRAQQLVVWIRWVMIAHGGYLVGVPNLIKTLSSLHSTLSKHASSLNRLLALQGRLDMLSAQLELRKEISALAIEDENAFDSDAEYVEGYDDEDIENYGVVLKNAGYIVGENDDGDEDEDEDDDVDDDDVDDDGEEEEDDDDGVDDEANDDNLSDSYGNEDDQLVEDGDDDDDDDDE